MTGWLAFHFGLQHVRQFFDSCVSSSKRHEGFTTLLTLHRNDDFSQVMIMFGEFERKKLRKHVLACGF